MVSLKPNGVKLRFIYVVGLPDSRQAKAEATAQIPRNACMIIHPSVHSACITTCRNKASLLYQQIHVNSICPSQQVQAALMINLNKSATSEIDFGAATMKWWATDNNTISNKLQSIVKFLCLHGCIFIHHSLSINVYIAWAVASHLIKI